MSGTTPSTPENKIILTDGQGLTPQALDATGDGTNGHLEARPDGTVIFVSDEVGD
jgi:hypothetical protein